MSYKKISVLLAAFLLIGLFLGSYGKPLYRNTAW